MRQSVPSLYAILSLTCHVNASLPRFAALEVRQAGGAGLGFVASREQNENDLLITVPTEVALSVESPGDGPDSQAARDLVTDRGVLRDSPWFAQFAVYLFGLDKVSSLKSRSLDMRPWLDVLPRSFNTPIHWDDSSKEQLQYAPLVDAVSRQETDWKRVYDSFLAAAAPELTKMTWEDFVWGCECARSRVFSGAFTGSAFNPAVYVFTLLLVAVYVGLGLGTLEQAANGATLVLCGSILRDFIVPKFLKIQRYVICPMIDMANHKSVGSTGDVSFEFFGDAYSLASTTGVAAGSDVSISYGDRSNDQLLQFYGFVEADNPNDVYIMPPLREWDIEELEKACGRKFSSGRLQKLDRAGLLGSIQTPDTGGEGIANPTGGVVITRSGGLDPAVLQALRALVSSEEEWQAAGEAIGNFATESSGGEQNERLALLAAKTAMKRELASKPTSLEEDVTMLKQIQSSKSTDEAYAELAVKFRIEKKKLLMETIATL